MVHTIRTLCPVFLVTLCFTQLSFAQDNRFPLEIIDLSTGTTSQMLMHEVRTEIAKSQLFRFTTKSEVRLQMRLNTIEVRQPNGSDLIIFSVVFTLANSKQVGSKSTFLSQTVDYCQSDDVEQTARRILRQTIMARAAIQEMIVAIIDGKIRSLVHSYSAN